MATWGSLAESANETLFGVFGETVSYSRPGSNTLDPIDAFSLTAIPDTGGEYLAPNATERAFTVMLADVTLGPKRGDLIVFREETFQVQTIVANDVDGTAMLGARKLPA
jgi:hypothetical protein